MKRIKGIIGLLLAFVLLLSAVGCSGSSLQAPGGFYIDDDLILNWSDVEHARVYEIEITPLDGGEVIADSTHGTYYPLEALAEGDYEIRLRSTGGSHNDLISEWSEPLSFKREHETGLLYSLINNNTEYEVKTIGSASGSLTVENSYRGKPVTRIGVNAFRASKKLEDVVISEGITSIGSAAFYNCDQLKTVTLPDTLSRIDTAAFQHCSSLTQINIPSAVTLIDDYVFTYCRSLESIDLGENITSIGESAFASCSAMRKIEIPDSVQVIGNYAFSRMDVLEEAKIGAGIIRIGNYAFTLDPMLRTVEIADGEGEVGIGNYAFAQCESLSHVDIPEGTTIIGNGAFMWDSALMEISIPDTVEYLGQYTFHKTGFYDAQMENGDGLVYADKWLIDATEDFKKTVTTLDSSNLRPGTFGIGTQAFIYWITLEITDPETGETYDLVHYVGPQELSLVDLPASVKYIGPYAFMNCWKLTRVWSHSPNSLVEVGFGAFMGCSVLNNVQFATGLRTIETYAFQNCSMLTNPQTRGLLIPDTVTRVGEYAFYNTALWNDEAIEDGIVYADDWVVGYRQDDFNSGTVELRDTTVGISDFAFFACEPLQNLSGLNRARIIGKGAFAYCINLAAVNLNPNLRTIEDYTFFECQKIFSVTFPVMLQSIGSHAFYNCIKLSEVNLLDTRVTEIKDGAFRSCTNLKSVDFGSTEQIERYAFFDCQSLDNVVLPDTVTEIGERAFAGCVSLKSVQLSAGLTEIKDYTFSDSALESVVIPSAIKKIGNFAFYNNANLKKVTLSEGLEEIGDYAFYGESELTQLVIPESVNAVGSLAFGNCGKLSYALLKGEIENMGDNAFFGCSRLSIYTLHDEGELWSGSWNSSKRPFIRGVELSEDGTYIRAITMGEIEYSHPRYGIGVPCREGYDFVGWATKEGSTVVDYAPGDFVDAPVGTKLYTVWTESVAKPEPETPSPQEPEEGPGEPTDPEKDPAQELQDYLDAWLGQGESETDLPRDPGE